MRAACFTSAAQVAPSDWKVERVADDPSPAHDETRHESRDSRVNHGPKYLTGGRFCYDSGQILFCSFEV